MMFSSNNQWLLIGLTSFGVGCANKQYSGIYTRVAAFQNWIKTYTNDSNWVVISHANNISTSASNLFVFIVLFFVVTFYH
jgi:secreted trypsin-like serine protease